MTDKSDSRPSVWATMTRFEMRAMPWGFERTFKMCFLKNILGFENLLWEQTKSSMVKTS